MCHRRAAWTSLSGWTWARPARAAADRRGGQARGPGLRGAEADVDKAHESRRFGAARRVLLPKDYLRWRLTGTQATDPSDASNTLLFDVTRRCWSDQLTEALGLPAAILPDVAEPAEYTGRVTPPAAAATGLAAGVPVMGGAGDSITAAIANALVPGGPVLTVLGSAGNVSAVFAEPLIDPAGRIHTGCHATPGTWIATGVQQAAGLALQWLRGLLAPGDDAAQASYAGLAGLAALAAAAEPGSDGLTFLPYLAGTRSPEYDPDARGAFAGLSLGHTTAHLVRAVMEGVAFAQRESAEVLAALGVPVRSVVTAGGGARSAVWRGIQAGVLGVPVSYYPAPGGDSSDTGPAGAGRAAGQFGARGRDPRWCGVGPVRLAGRRRRAGPGRRSGGDRAGSGRGAQLPGRVREVPAEGRGGCLVAEKSLTHA